MTDTFTAKKLRPHLSKRIANKLRLAKRRLRTQIDYRTHRKQISRKIEATQKVNVVVVGAGIGGLATAYELQNSGHHVTLLEASAQIGGRASTIREPFTEGLYLDAGGFRCSTDHFQVRDYLKQFGLKRTPFFPADGEMFAYLDGKLIRRRAHEPVDPNWFSRPLTDEEVWMFNQETEDIMFRIDGGVDCLVEAVNSRLVNKVQLHSKVIAIKHSGSDMTVEFLHEGETESIRADHVVFAIPYSVLREIKFTPELSAEKSGIISGLQYREGMLIYFQIPTEYWLEQDLTGFGVTDTVGEIWTPALDRSSEMTLTLSYTKDEAARELLAMPQEERIRVVGKRMEEFLPYFSDFIQQSIAICWDEDDLIRGSRSTAMFLSEAEMELVRRPENRIHFAGEHTAGLQLGWIEGALESAKRVTAEINIENSLYDKNTHPLPPLVKGDKNTC